MSTKHFNYLVIGGGSGGVASSRRAASYGAKVLLIEAGRIGGTCVNVGCVPKKVMWYASDVAHKISHAREYGFNLVDPAMSKTVDWGYLKEKRDAYVARLNGIYERNLEKEGVELLYGYASFKADKQVEVKTRDGKVHFFTADKILIATGGHSVYPKHIPGYEYGIDSDKFFSLETQPKRVAIVGAGYIGCELSCVFNSLGSDSHLIIRGETVLRKFDNVIGDTLTKAFEDDGIHVHKHSNVTKVEKGENGELKVFMDSNPNGEPLIVDCLVWTIGRKSLLSLNPGEINLKLNNKEQIVTNEWQETNIDNIYSLGDVTGRVELTPVAIAAGRKLSNRLFGPKEFSNDKLDYTNVPSVIFTHPEAASIGMSEKEAEAKYGKDQIKIYKSRFTEMFYAMCEKKEPTVYKLIVAGSDEKVVGLHLVGPSSSEILQGFGVAIKMGATKKDFDNCVAIHPSSAEEIVTLR